MPHNGIVTGIIMVESYILTCGIDGLLKMWMISGANIQWCMDLKIEQQAHGTAITSIVYVASKGHIIGGCSTGFLTCWQYDASNPGASHFMGNMQVFLNSGVHSLIMEPTSQRILAVSDKGDLKSLDATSPN